MALLVPGFLATVAVTAKNGGTAEASQSSVETRSIDVMASHAARTPRGVWLEFDDIAEGRRIESAVEGAPTSAMAEPSKRTSNRPGTKRNGGIDFGWAAGGPSAGPAASVAQVMAAKRETSMLDLGRRVRQACRSDVDAAPSSVNVKASISVDKGGKADRVTVSGNNSGVERCVERVVRAYSFPAEAASSTVEIPFSWRKQ